MALTKVTNHVIATNAISGTLIADNAITAVHIAQNAITQTQIAAGALSDVLAANSITAAMIPNDLIDSDHFADGGIDTAHLAADVITGAKIADDAIDSEHYTDGSIDTAHITDLNVTTAKIANNAITAAKLPDNVITATMIPNATNLTLGTVTAALTGNASGTAATVTGGTQASITSAANLVTVGTIGTGVWQGTAVASGYIAADAITGAKIADDAIDSEHYTDASIDLAHMSSQSVDEDNLYISNSGSNGQFLSKQSGNSGGLTWAAAGADFDTAITINESGADVDFRVESDDQTHMFFIDGGNDKIGVGTAAPSTRLEIYGNDNQLSIDGASNANIALFFKEAGTIMWELYHRGSTDDFRIYNGPSARFDMAIKSDGKVGFGTVSPTTNLTAATSANILQTALTSSSNAIAWDAIAKANAYHVTTENTTFSAPSNPVEGAIISVEIAQGGTARTIAWNTVFEFAASTAPTITATASKTDIMTFRYNGSVWQEIGRVQNMAQT